MRNIIVVAALLVTVPSFAAAPTKGPNTAVPATAAATAGKISDISSPDGVLEVDVRTGTELKTHGVGAALLVGDTVITPAGTMAMLLLEDETQVVVGPNSQFTIGTVAGSGGAASTFLKVSLGMVRLLVKKIFSSDQTFRVSAGNSVMGVRGTSFIVDQESPLNTTIDTIEGKVTLARSEATLDDPSASVLVEGGFTSSLTGSSKVLAPARPFKRDELIAHYEKKARGFGRLFVGSPPDAGGANSVDYGIKKPKAAPPKADH